MECNIEEFLRALESGEIRAAYKDAKGRWQANSQVKKGILQAFTQSEIAAMGNEHLPFTDKSVFTVQRFDVAKKIRVVPGGTSVRRGVFVGNSVTIMPPAYLNVGAFVDEGCMIDSHALVGSCAQIGARVHLSAASQIGGVLEPVGAAPVIVEEDAFIGGNCGIYEGCVVRARAVLGAGVILTRSTKVFDLVNNKIIAASQDLPLEIPEDAVVIPGMRRVQGDFAREHGLSVASPIIIKYRDARTDSKATLEDALRS